MSREFVIQIDLKLLTVDKLLVLLVDEISDGLIVDIAEVEEVSDLLVLRKKYIIIVINFINFDLK